MTEEKITKFIFNFIQLIKNKATLKDSLYISYISKNNILHIFKTFISISSIVIALFDYEFRTFFNFHIGFSHILT